MDQAPLQNVAPDWKWGSTGCYDIASLTRLQCKLQSGAPLHTLALPQLREGALFRVLRVLGGQGVGCSQRMMLQPAWQPSNYACQPG